MGCANGKNVANPTKSGKRVTPFDDKQGTLNKDDISQTNVNQPVTMATQNQDHKKEEKKDGVVKHYIPK